MTNISKKIEEVVKSAVKSLDVVNIEDAKEKISDLKFVGNGDLFQLLAKASSKSQGWMKSTKVMEVPGGVVVQVTTQNWDNVAEALTYVPGVKVGVDGEGNKVLVSL